MGLILLTNVSQYTGPGALDALLQDGHRVACHDASFVDAAARSAFDGRRPSMRGKVRAQRPCITRS